MAHEFTIHFNFFLYTNQIKNVVDRHVPNVHNLLIMPEGVCLQIHYKTNSLIAIKFICFNASNCLYNCRNLNSRRTCSNRWSFKTRLRNNKNGKYVLKTEFYSWVWQKVIICLFMFLPTNVPLITILDNHYIS